MRTPMSRARSVAWLLVAALAACSHKPEAAEQPPAAPPPKPTAAQESQKSFELATQEQQALTEQLGRVEAAHEAVIAARQQLAEAQALEQQERAKAQLLQEQATAHLEQSVEHAQQAQAGVAGMGTVLEGMQTAAGRVAQAAPSQFILQMPSGHAMTFTVDERTRVLVGTDQRSITDVQQGADAQVAYEPREGQLTALVVRVMPAGSPPATTPPGSPPATSPPERPEPPAR